MTPTVRNWLVVAAAVVLSLFAAFAVAGGLLMLAATAIVARLASLVQPETGIARV